MASVLEQPGTAAIGQGAARMVRVGGALLSVALVAGVAIWGYRLMVRDVNGIPVVRAMEGAMREQPIDPGGEVNPHRGLAVNAIAAEGEAAPTGDVLLLAPQTVGLAPDDLEMGTRAEADEVMAEDLVIADPSVSVVVPMVGTAPEPGLVVRPVVVPSAPLTAEQVLAMADEITAGIAPLTELAPETDAGVATLVDGGAAGGGGAAIIPATVPGVARALRPPLRPGSLAAAAGASAAVAVPVAPEIRPDDFPVGTALVQFGAFDTPQLAMTAWADLTARFGEFLIGKEPVIQQAQSGGEMFYRLRTIGFADRPEAQRFCAAFAAEARECVPYVVQ